MPPMTMARESSFVSTLIDLVGRKNTTLNRRKQSYKSKWITSMTEKKKKTLVISSITVVVWVEWNLNFDPYAPR